MSPPGTAPTPAISWRLLGMLFVASGAMGLMTLPFSQAQPFLRWPVAIIAAVAVVPGLITVVVARRLPEGLLIVGLVNCATLVSLAVAVSGGPDSPYLILYAWTGVEAWYFLRRTQAIWFTALSGVITGVTLALSSASGGPLPRGSWSSARWSRSAC